MAESSVVISAADPDAQAAVPAVVVSGEILIVLDVGSRYQLENVAFCLKFCEFVSFEWCLCFFFLNISSLWCCRRNYRVCWKEHSSPYFEFFVAFFVMTSWCN